MTTFKDVSKQQAVTQESEELSLNITAISAMRLGHVLELAAQELCGGGDEQFLCDFAITWSQLFTMYGRAKSVELYMPNEDIRLYRADLEAYRLGHLPTKGDTGKAANESVALSEVTK